MQDVHRAIRPCGGEVFEHADHGCAADPGGDQHERGVGVVEHHVAERGRQGEFGACPDLAVQLAGDLALGGVGDVRHPFDGDAPQVVAWGVGQAVLAGLVDAVGHEHPDADVLAGAGRGNRAVVGRAQQEGHHVRGLLPPLHDGPLTPRIARVDLCFLVEAGLPGDEGAGHQPVDLVPGGGHLGGDRLAQYVGDRAEQVLVDDRVLVLGDAESGVLVGDAGEKGVRSGVGVVQQCRGEAGDGPGQRPALFAACLAAALEQPVQQFGLLGEHGSVEAGRDLVQRPADGGQGGADDGGGSGESMALLCGAGHTGDGARRRRRGSVVRTRPAHRSCRFFREQEQD